MHTHCMVDSAWRWQIVYAIQYDECIRYVQKLTGSQISLWHENIEKIHDETELETGLQSTPAVK